MPPTQIAQLQGCSGRRVYGSVVGAAEYCRRRDGAPFAAEQYLASPEDFESVFAAQLAPFATAIVNGIYWEARYPRLISMRETDALLASPASRLLAIADITCDLHVRRLACALTRAGLYRGDQQGQLDQRPLSLPPRPRPVRCMRALH